MRLFTLVLYLLVMPLTGKADISNNQLTFAVGHDHDRMLSPDYPMYIAKWQFITESLAKLGYSVKAKPLPWARAKHLTETGKADGLFLAANLPGREKWAKLSLPLGFGVFGTFYHKQNPTKNDVIASIRLGLHDRILADVPSEELLLVATAHQGFKLLFNQKVDRFVMSESYGRYLLNTELSAYRAKLDFDTSMIEQRSTHIAFANNKPSSLDALNIVNKAIKLGIEQGLYQTIMTRHGVPKRMQIKQ